MEKQGTAKYKSVTCEPLFTKQNYVQHNVWSEGAPKRIYERYHLGLTTGSTSSRAWRVWSHHDWKSISYDSYRLTNAAITLIQICRVDWTTLRQCDAAEVNKLPAFTPVDVRKRFHEQSKPENLVLVHCVASLTFCSTCPCFGSGEEFLQALHVTDKSIKTSFVWECISFQICYTIKQCVTFHMSQLGANIPRMASSNQLPTRTSTTQSALTSLSAPSVSSPNLQSFTAWDSTSVHSFFKSLRIFINAFWSLIPHPNSFLAALHVNACQGPVAPLVWPRSVWCSVPQKAVSFQKTYRQHLFKVPIALVVSRGSWNGHSDIIRRNVLAVVTKRISTRCNTISNAE